MESKEPKGAEERAKGADLSDMDSSGKPRQPGVRHGIADADKVARTGSKDEPVRNTPPAGAWNDTSAD